MVQNPLCVLTHTEARRRLRRRRVPAAAELPDLIDITVKYDARRISHDRKQAAACVVQTDPAGRPDGSKQRGGKRRERILALRILYGRVAPRLSDAENFKRLTIMQHSLRLQRRQAIQYSLIARRIQIKRICVVERQQRME